MDNNNEKDFSDDSLMVFSGDENSPPSGTGPALTSTANTPALTNNDSDGGPRTTDGRGSIVSTPTKTNTLKSSSITNIGPAIADTRENQIEFEPEESKELFDEKISESEVKLQKSEVKPPEPEVKPLESEVKQHESEVFTPESKLKHHESEINSLESKINSLESEVKTLESEVTPLESEVKQPESEVQQPESEVQQPESEIQQIPESEVILPEPEVEPPKPESKPLEPEEIQPDPEVKSIELELKSLDRELKHLESVVKSSGPKPEPEPEPELKTESELESRQEFELEPKLIETSPTKTMEFGKNYSDDLLMGRNDGAGQAQTESHDTNADLADFELPPYSGSSSGSSDQSAPAPTTAVSSTPSQSSPTYNSNKKAQQFTTPATSSSQSTSSSSAGSGLSSPSFAALRDSLKSSYSKVSHIFHWKKPIESGVFFAIGATLIIALTFFSIISVVAYSTLGLMLASGSIRIYKTVMKTLNRSTDTPVDHIWNKVLALNVSMSHEKMHQLVDSSLGNLNASLKYFKQVLLIEDKVATIKFGIFVYFLTYIGAWFNGLTLITMVYLGLFTVPILYEKNKTKIDEILNLATKHVCSVTSLVSGKIGSIVSSGSSTGSKKQD